MKTPQKHTTKLNRDSANIDKICHRESKLVCSISHVRRSGANSVRKECLDCGGKYTACICASGYEWNGSSCQKQVFNGAQGNLYYCNGTVVGVKVSGMSFYIALKDVGYTDLNSAITKSQSYVFCGTLKGSFHNQSQLSTIYSNKSALNNQLSQYGGSNISEGYYWSSNSSGGLFNMTGKDKPWSGAGANARPILTSW